MRGRKGRLSCMASERAAEIHGRLTSGGRSHANNPSRF